MTQKNVKVTVIDGPVPAVPFKTMHRILSQWVYANKIPLRMDRWEEVVRAFYLYNDIAKILN